MWKEDKEEIDLNRLSSNENKEPDKAATDPLDFDWKEGDDIHRPQFVGLSKEELKQYENDPFWKRVRLILFLLFWIVWAAFLVAAALVLAYTPKCPKTMKLDWWQTGVGYSVEAKSFYDRNGDGFGDLKGLIDKLDYIKSTGFTFIILSDSLFANGSLSEIDPLMGNMTDLRNLITSAWKQDIHVVLEIPWKKYLLEHPRTNESSVARAHMISSIDELVSNMQVDGVNFNIGDEQMNFTMVLDVLNEVRRLLDKIAANKLRPKVLIITALKNIALQLSEEEYKRLLDIAGLFVNPHYLSVSNETTIEDIQQYLSSLNASQTLKFGWQIDNLYSKRFSARDIAFNKAFPLLFLSTGTPIVTYGSELLMKGTITPNGTYSACSPMMWSGGKNAQFTDGTPWLPVEQNYAEQNVDYFGAHGMLDSPFPLLQALMSLRTNNSLLYGKVNTYVKDNIIFWTAEELGYPGYLIVLNWNDASHLLLDHKMFGLKNNKMKLVLDCSDISKKPTEITALNLYLNKKACLVLEWSPKRVK